jgi:hypothetical protein
VQCHNRCIQTHTKTTEIMEERNIERLLLNAEGKRVLLSEIPLLYKLNFDGSKMEYSGKLSKFISDMKSFSITTLNKTQWVSFAENFPQLSQLKPAALKTPRNPQKAQNDKAVPTTTLPVQNRIIQRNYMPTMEQLIEHSTLKDQSESTVDLWQLFFGKAAIGLTVAARNGSKNDGTKPSNLLFVNGKALIVGDDDRGIGLLGQRIDLRFLDHDTDDLPEDQAIYINTSIPFCAVCIGVQGSGKSHTMNVLLENCIIPVPTKGRPFISLPQPMCGLVLHYDQSESNLCEAVGLRKCSSMFPHKTNFKVQKVVILVSPCYYEQRKRFYGNSDKCEVFPLLFDWKTISAVQLRKLMRLSEKDTQLYVSVMLNMLRKYQRDQTIPEYAAFAQEVKELCTVNGQSGPLEQVNPIRRIYTVFFYTLYHFFTFF